MNRTRKFGSFANPSLARVIPTLATAGWILGWASTGLAQVAGQPGQPAGYQQQPGQQAPAGNTVQVPVMSAQQAMQQGLAKAPEQPFPAIRPDEQQFLDGVLKVWEERTAQVERYTCEFKRWQYDPTRFWNKANPVASYYSEASGEIKYMAPDKGCYEVKDLKVLANVSPPEYRPNPERPHGEYWVCDGSWVYIRDRNEKKEERYELPPNQRGAMIEDSPLPFLFGVKADKLKQRYWLRPIKSDENSVWLEAWPKRPDDAGNYSRVQIVLSRKDILPSALIVFMPNWSAEAEHKEIFEFTNRKEPTQNSLLQFFGQQFIPNSVPSGWKIEKFPWKDPRVAMPAGNPSGTVNR